MEREPIREDLSPYADALAERLLQRQDLYARQLDDGSYVAVYKPLRTGHVLAHLRGKMTLGAYVLDENSHGRFMVLDADDAPDWRRLVALSRALTEEGATTYLEKSRRGGHLWSFFDRPRSGAEIRDFGSGLLNYYGIQDLELFPKQRELRSGPGSLIRLPFGVHRKSGARYGFYLPDGEPLAPTLREQIMSLRAPQTIPDDLFDRYLSYWSTVREKAAPERSGRPLRRFSEGDANASLPERVKGAISTRQFIMRYVELSPSGKGLCPFHDDHHESFSVSDEKGFWYCFACEEGGSIIDFWMKWTDVDFSDALRGLADSFGIA